MFISTGVSLLGAQPSGGGLWTPADVTTTAWYDASDSSTVTVSGTDVKHGLIKVEMVIMLRKQVVKTLHMLQH